MSTAPICNIHLSIEMEYFVKLNYRLMYKQN